MVLVMDKTANCDLPVCEAPRTDRVGAAFKARVKAYAPDIELDFTPAIEQEMKPLYTKLKSLFSKQEWAVHAPYIKAINDLKKQRNAVILAHNYMTPEIFHGVADFVGDSLALAKEAQKSDANVIVQCGVHFMAETSKILSPEKTVLIPDSKAGCSLAEAITAQDVRDLRKQYPGVPIVSYVNTTAEVKAEVDICCTSANAVQIVESLNAPQVLLVPDKYLAENVNNQTDVEVIPFEGRCEVHEQFTAPQLRSFRKAEPDMKIIAHPECPAEVLEEADFAGSTGGMIDWVKDNQPEKVMLVTECSMSDNIAVENPNVEFIRPCNLCPYMKMITLPKILDSLLFMQEKVEVDPELGKKALRSVLRMIDVKL